MQRTYHIHINGIVQGVGFRPYVFRLAKAANLCGTVSNGSDGVHIFVNATQNQLEQFTTELVHNPLIRSKIGGLLTEVIEEKIFDSFQIIDSSDTGEKRVMLTPDYAICNACKTDVLQKENQRYNYAFTTCTVCGPRFSIIEKLPYDRENTSMRSFEMCEKCAAEYDDVEDRRYYSQTNSCANCGISLSYMDSGSDIEKKIDQHSIINQVIQDWKNGKIVAIQGIGGYLLTCDATNPVVIQELRRRKNRPTKPFAVMYHDLYLLAEDVDVDVAAMLEMQNEVAPIVLLTKKKDPWLPVDFEGIAPGLSKIGVMLPYTPLYVLLLKEFSGPVIATSGNLSGEPIAFTPEEAMEDLQSIADVFVHNDRKILVPQDDSLVNLSPIKRSRIVMRRSRGLAPSYIPTSGKNFDSCVLSMGGLLKSTFGLNANGNLFISQYLGDTDSYKTQQNYNAVLGHFLKIFKVLPKAIICDKHPTYFSSMEGQRLADHWNLPLIKVQHHIAHFYAILGEHDLQKKDDKVFGVIWDGTGLGDDGNIWGGEFFTFRSLKIKRVGHLPYFQYIAGDKMAREPRISALSMLYSYNFSIDHLQSKFSREEWAVYTQLLKTGSKIMCSSMGRLFDAMASIILNIDTQLYEGEAAMMLEQAAHEYFSDHLPHIQMSYFRDLVTSEINIHALVKVIVADLEKGVNAPFIAARFHVSLVDYIDHIASLNKAKKLAFSGGVFQNAWLVDIIQLLLSKKYSLYFHQEFSPNDENIAFGQLIYYFEKQEV